MKKLTTQEFIEKAKQVHDNFYDYSKTEYVISRQNVIIICPLHGEFEQRPSSHLSGCGCPKCAANYTSEHKQALQNSLIKSRGMTTEEWIERVRRIHGDKYDYSQTVYVNQRTNVKIICPIHGVFEQKADSHIRGYGCRLCGLQSEHHKGVHNWTKSQYEKTANTCMERYGAARFLDSDKGKKLISDIKSTADYRQKMHDMISSDEVQAKTKQTCLSRYGTDSVMKLSITVDKVCDSKRKHGSWSTSKSEETMYLLLIDVFGEHDVIRQYKDPRYPYCCDFYIKSLDLFIELNATWLHGGHWFNDINESDLNKLTRWSNKVQQGSKFYQVAIDVWTVRDVNKRLTALKNNLNYVVFWCTDLSDFKAWLYSDKLKLNNIIEQ